MFQIICSTFLNLTLAVATFTHTDVTTVYNLLLRIYDTNSNMHEIDFCLLLLLQLAVEEDDGKCNFPSMHLLCYVTHTHFSSYFYINYILLLW